LTIEITIASEYHDFQNVASKFASWFAFFLLCHQKRLRFVENLEMDERNEISDLIENTTGIGVRIGGVLRVVFKKW